MSRDFENGRPEIIKCCAYCEHASILRDEDYILCRKKGVVSQAFRCRRFVYDPTKRIPKRLPTMPELDVALIDKTI